MGQNNLLVSAVSGYRGNLVLFKNLNFSLHSGEWLQVMGPNGSGKSTLLKMLAGLLPINYGNIQTCEQSQIAYIGHKLSLQPALTVVENLYSLSALFTSDVDENLLSQAITSLGLVSLKNTLCRQLSEGQLKRVSLARLLLVKFKLWLLDEPLAALDTDGKEIFQQMLVKYLSEGGVAVIATHEAIAIGCQSKCIKLTNHHG